MRAAGTAASIERGKALTRNFLDARLLRGLPDRDRALLLDLAVFDWVDTELVDEVLESTDTRLRVEAPHGSGRTPGASRSGGRRVASAPAAEGALRRPARR